jgi:hypothetical protein
MEFLRCSATELAAVQLIPQCMTNLGLIWFFNGRLVARVNTQRWLT